jgi:putative flippase GtrA
METFWSRVRKLLFLKIKFALSGLVATSVDYGLYLALVDRFFPPVVSNIISYSFAVIINFLMQKRFVFTLKGSVARAFTGSIIVSLAGLLLSTLLVFMLTKVQFLDQRQYLLKLIATGLIFFYNFYMKRFVFERRFVD